MIDTLKTLCYLGGVSGVEDEVRDYILERVMPYADKLSADPLGNLIVFRKGAKEPENKIMLCANMDEAGLMISGFLDDGYLRFACVGAVEAGCLIGKRVYVGPDRVCGVIGIKPIHLVPHGEREKLPEIDDLYIDIGCTDRVSAEKLVKPGDCCTFYDSVVEFGDGSLKAKALDSRVGCAVMVKLIENELPCDTWFAFTAQKHVGVRGAQAAAYDVAPDIAIVLDGAEAADMPGLDGKNASCRCGGGAVVPLMDAGAIYDKELCARIKETADRSGIAVQAVCSVSGTNDSKAIQRSRVGVRTAAICAPVRNINSPVSVGKISDFESVYSLTARLLEELV